MLDPNTVLVHRFGHQRPGLDLVAVEDAALPVTIVRADVLAQERKSLPLLDEFVLRLTDAGLDHADELASFLGLDVPLVETNVADQAISNRLRLNGDSTFGLTSHGRHAVRELEAVQPVQQQLPIVFDRMTWGAANYRRDALITKEDAREAQMFVLPAGRTSHIGLDEITAPALNALLSVQASAESRVEILKVRGVVPNSHRFLPVKLLVYADAGRSEIQLAVAVDEDLSQAHELALAELGGADGLGIRVDAPADRPVLSPELEQARVPSDEVERLRSATISERVNRASTDAAVLVRSEPASRPERELAEISVRSVGVFEHRELLNEALESARTRILIVSPWIKSTVVDTEFVSRIERRLRQGVVVHIAHGIGDDDHGSDRPALKRLGNLQRRYPQLFTFARLANTHAKILIFDDQWISTSFNWLSFRGGSDRYYRMEEGTLVQMPPEVDKQYAEYVRLISEQRVG